MPKPSLIAVAGAAAIAGGLIGVAALSQTAPTRTRDVALVAGEADIFLPQLNTFMPESANGFPPFADVLQGTELWNLVNRDEIEYLTGTDTQTTVGSFVNDDFFELAGHNMFETPPAPGSEIDLANFGGGYEVEWARLYDAAGGSTTTDTVITPFGNYTIPLGTTTAAGAAAFPAVVDGYSFADFTAAIHNTVAAGEQWFTEAATAFTAGEYPLALAEELAGFNNLTVGVTNDVLTNGYAVLTASDGNAGFALENVGQPADFTAGLSDAQLFLANAQSDVGLALTEFANGNIYFGLTDLASSNTESVFATDAIILGLFDSVPGMVFTS